MRKRQKLADAQALSVRLGRIEELLMARRLNLDNAYEIDAIVADVQALEKGKFIIAPQLLHRVKALASVARQLRAFAAKEVQ
jgi:hypothetical protein